MIAYLILGVALLAGLALLAYWFANADPKVVVRALRWTSAILGGIVVLFLIFFGRHVLAALLLPLLPLLLLMLLRSRALWQRIKAAAGPTPGQEFGILRVVHMFVVVVVLYGSFRCGGI